MTATEAPTNTKAGWSSYCHRDQHRTCTTLQARCTCTCHGRTGQAPPTRTPPKEPTMPEPAPLAAVPDPPHIEPVKLHECGTCGRTFANRQGLASHEATHGGEHRCDDCGAVFNRANGLSRHRNQTHGSGKPATPDSGFRKSAPAAPRPSRPKLDTASVKEALDDDGYDPWVVLVGHLDGDQAVVATALVSTEGDAQQVAGLLQQLGHKPRRFRLNDAQEG